MIGSEVLLHECLENAARREPGKAAVIFDNTAVSYSQIDRAANCLANAFIQHGLCRQDRVAIYLGNSLECVVSLYAALKAGGVFAIINPQAKKAKLAYILNDCGAQTLVTDAQGLAVVSDALHDCPHLSTIVVTDRNSHVEASPGSPGKECLSYKGIIEEGQSSRPPQSCIDIDLASLVYTSGSTGEPKGVMLTHLNMLTAARSIIHYLGNDSRDVVIDVLPLSFDYGLYQVLMSFMFGGTVVLERSFVYPYQILNSILRHKVTGFPLVPTVASMLLTLRNLGSRDFSHLRYVTSTGQTLPPAHIARLRQVFPNAEVFSMYGLTECKRVSFLPPEELDRRPSSVGKAIPNTEVYIVDEDGREITLARTPGQLVVRGSHVMAGYWGLPDKTAERLRPGRYPGERVLLTGDMFEKDEDGFLYFLGRRDDMFKSSGQFVSPREVENVLHECDGVAEAAVIGVDDEMLGQAVVAFVVKAQQSQMSESDIIGFCSRHLEKHLVPKKIVFCQSLPRTPTGKVHKSALRERDLEKGL
jgi:amino acid adenylation domain-containing protein